MFGSLGQVLCAACGNKMKIFLIEPSHQLGSEITFKCTCGHIRQLGISRRTEPAGPLCSVPA
jgi:hypothetical protein